MCAKPTHPLDPRGLILEAYRIEGIHPADCRSIYFDWALGLDPGTDALAATRVLLDEIGATAPDHPMTAVLREGLETSARPRPSRRRSRGEEPG